MGLYEHFPYTNFHELNLDWILAELKKVRDMAEGLGESIEEAVNKYIADHPEMFPFVTPQMYGAKGDGSTPDNGAFQAACNSGYDIYVPTSKGEIYLITSTITIPAGGTKRIYGLGGWRMPNAGGGHIRFRFTDSASGSETPLFRLAYGVAGFSISDLRIVGGTITSGENAGTIIDAVNQYIDKDITLERVQFVNATRAIDFSGRGLKCYHCEFNSCTAGVRINWVQGSTDSFGSRSIIFDACRWHSITPTAIYVQTGHAYGMSVKNCFCDHGCRCLVRAEEQAINWAIQNNSIEEATASGATNRYIVELRGGADGCNISGNTVQGGTYNLVRVTGGTFTYCAVNGNIAREIVNHMIYVGSEVNASYISIVGNVADLDGSLAIVRVEAPATNYSHDHFNITGNVTNASVASGTTPTNSYTSGNVSSAT